MTHKNSAIILLQTRTFGSIFMDTCQHYITFSIYVDCNNHTAFHVIANAE